MGSLSKKVGIKGFSLIELSIVLVVIGIVIAMALPLSTAQMNVKKYSGTADKLDSIQKALNLYVKVNGGLPCPASKTVEPDTASFGVATNCSVAAAAGTLEVGTNPNYVRIGAVPVRTLNLPENMMFDAWGRRFTYAVAKSSAGSSLSTGIISVVDDNGNSVTTPASTATYVVFSSGAEGKGTHLRHGAASAVCGTVTKDSENCDNDITFRDMAMNDGGVAANFFDDVIRWGTTATINEEIGAGTGGSGGGR